MCFNGLYELPDNDSLGFETSNNVECYLLNLPTCSVVILREYCNITG